jgi:hypothetical protein
MPNIVPVPHPRQEGTFLEHPPWPVSHRLAHQQQISKQGGRIPETAHHAAFMTPASQKHDVDIHAPNGSASTIPENPSAPSSSTANTPYGKDQEAHTIEPGQSGPDFEALNRKSGYRSQSSSPLDVRKSQPSQGYHKDPRPIPPTSQDTRTEPHTRHTGYSPPSRLGMFGTSKREDTPPILPKSLNNLHSSSGIVTSTNINRMTAR